MCRSSVNSIGLLKGVSLSCDFSKLSFKLCDSLFERDDVTELNCFLSRFNGFSRVDSVEVLLGHLSHGSGLVVASGPFLNSVGCAIASILGVKLRLELTRFVL